MRMLKLLAIAGLFAGAYLSSPSLVRAADHGDAPNIDNDQGSDIADVFMFLDPNDNTKVIVIGTVHGFIVPGEAGNFGAFDPQIQYRFDFEQTGDAKADSSVLVTFSERTAGTAPQTATIQLPGKKKPKFTATTTPPNFTDTPTTQAITTDPVSGVKFFAGLVDDPFFFDIPAFQRFIGSVVAGTPDATVFSRGRDSFAGYNILGIAMSFPIDMIRGASTNNELGVEFITLRRTQSVDTKHGGFKASGKFRQVDRMGNPAVNVALIPFAKKSLHNAGTPIDDSKGKFAGDIVATLTLLGTDQAHQDALAAVAITRGDYVRLDLTKANTGPQGGTNPEAAFPNGRRLADDTIDILLTIIANGATLGDSVNASETPPQDQFPFLALPHQPLGPGVTDDTTRN
jgi:hypothetical protein